MVSEWPGSGYEAALEFSVARGAQEMDNIVAIDMGKCHKELHLGSWCFLLPAVYSTSCVYSNRC